MAELMDVIPTVIGGAVALKLIDYALPDKKSKIGGKDMRKKVHHKAKAHHIHHHIHIHHHHHLHGKLGKVM